MNFENFNRTYKSSWHRFKIKKEVEGCAGNSYDHVKEVNENIKGENSNLMVQDTGCIWSRSMHVYWIFFFFSKCKSMNI